MHFKTLTNWLGETSLAECSLCGKELFAGEEIWRCNGETICSDCFLPFAQGQLAPFRITLGEEEME